MAKHLLAVIELGGYPDFRTLYESLGFTVHVETSVRNAIRAMKKTEPAVIVAEFNFQSDFRDRTSSLESLLSTVQRLPKCDVVIFFEQEFAHQLAKLTAQYPIAATLAFPIDPAVLQATLMSLA